MKESKQVKKNEKSLLNIQIESETKELLKKSCQLSGLKMGHIVDTLIREWLDKKLKNGAIDDLYFFKN